VEGLSFLMPSFFGHKDFPKDLPVLPLSLLTAALTIKPQVVAVMRRITSEYRVNKPKIAIVSK